MQCDQPGCEVLNVDERLIVLGSGPTPLELAKIYPSPGRQTADTPYFELMQSPYRIDWLAIRLLRVLVVKVKYDGC